MNSDFKKYGFTLGFDFDNRKIAEEVLKRIKQLVHSCGYCTIYDIFEASKRTHLMEEEDYKVRFVYGYDCHDIPKKPILTKGKDLKECWSLIFPEPGIIEMTSDGKVHVRKE